MKVKVFYPDFDGRISLTKEELENLLDEVYSEGYHDGKQTRPTPITWTSPSWPYGNTTTIPYYTTLSSNDSYSVASNSVSSSSCTVTSKDVPYTYTTSSNATDEPEKYSAKAIKYAS